MQEQKKSAVFNQRKSALSAGKYFFPQIFADKIQRRLSQINAKAKKSAVFNQRKSALSAGKDFSRRYAQLKQSQKNL